VSARPTFVVLGASNVQLALPIVVEELGRRADGPFDVLVAAGHGRSYGGPSRFLARELPGIAQSGLWAALDALAASRGRDGAPPRALVCDVGNDLMYGSPAETVARWVEECVARLAGARGRTVLVGLPCLRLERVSPAGFSLLSTLVFPFHPRLELAPTRDAARELDRRLRALAERETFLEPQTAWYGIDPIHFRRAQRRAAWSAIAEAAAGPARRPAWSLTAADRRAVRSALPERRAVLGWWRTRAQPAARLADGSTLALY
jgi:hypothetical protein